MTLKNDENFEEELACHFKIEFDNLWYKHMKILILMGSFWVKYIMFALTKYRGVIFDRTEDLRKIWRKNDLCFQKWHKEFGKFSPGHLEISEWVLWWDTFIQNEKYMSLKFAGKLCVMAMRNGGKIEEELTCQF